MMSRLGGSSHSLRGCLLSACTPVRVWDSLTANADTLRSEPSLRAVTNLREVGAESAALTMRALLLQGSRIGLSPSALSQHLSCTAYWTGTGTSTPKPPPVLTRATWNHAPLRWRRRKLTTGSCFSPTGRPRVMSVLPFLGCKMK